MTQTKGTPKSKFYKIKLSRNLGFQSKCQLNSESVRRAEAMLAESQRISHLGSWDWDMATDKVQFSDEMFRLVGLLPGQREVTGEEFIKFFHPDETERLRRDFKQNGSNQHFDIEHRVILPSGETRNMRTRVKAYKDENGFPLRLLGSTQDVTSQKYVENKLKESEWRNRLISELTADYVFILDVAVNGSLKFRWVSDNMFQMTGWAPEDLSVTDAWGSMFHPEDKGIFFEFIRRVLSKSYMGSIECRTFHKEGHVRWVRIFARPEVNAENKITAIVGAVKDISESKKAEEDLRQSEEKYRFLIENMKDIIWQASPDLKFTYISKAGQLLEGYKPEEIIGRSIFDFMTPESKSELMERISVRKNLLQNGERIDDAVYEVQYIKKNGELIWVEVSVYPMYDEVGRLTHFQGLTRDINYRKQMEEDLRESEFRNRAMVEAIPDLIFIQNREGTYIDYHAPNPQLLVAQPKLLLGCNVRDVLPPELAAEFLPKFDLAFETGKIQKHEYFLDAIEGKRCFESRMIAYSNDMLLSIVRDITQQKAMEQTLIEMGEIQRLLLNSIESTSIILLDLAEIVLTVNDFGIKLFEKNRDEIVGRFIYELFPTDSIEAKALLEERRKHFQEVIQTATPVTFEDFRQGIWFENNFYPILDNEGNVIQVAVYARDITKQKEKELLLSQSEKHYRALAESSQDMIYVIDRNDCFVYVNACVERYFGLFPDAFIGQPRSKFFRLPEVEMTRKNLNQVLETGTPFYSEAEFTLSIGKVYLSTWLVPLINSEGVVESVLGVSHDTTRFKDLEMALVEVNLKLESKVEERTRELLASRNQSKALTRQVVSAQEEERRRLSRELHDEAGQALVGLRFSLDAIYREIPENDLKINKHIAQSLVMVDQTLSRIRSLAYELRPPVLELMGIDSSIKQLCQDYSEKTGVKIEYSGQKLENLEDEIGISLYRFVQEALTNVAKHAQAAKVQVKLNYHDGIITSSVQDDGQGISKNFGKGLGLLGIKERFEVLDGQVEIRPCEPKGTIIQVSLPWKAFKTPLKTKYSSAL